VPSRTNRRLILASASPRRRELLSLLGLPFAILSAPVDETIRAGESPLALVQRLSRAKAQAVAASPGHGLILAADTVVVLPGVEDRLLGKPADAAEAEAMLRALRDRTHKVCSGVAVLDQTTGQLEQSVAESTVWMRAYTDEELHAYVQSGDPLDKAGAYAIQDPGFRPVARVDGCWASVMGLPLCHVTWLLRELGILPPADVAGACQAYHQLQCPVADIILPS
jgi:septum formation protein